MTDGRRRDAEEPEAPEVPEVVEGEVVEESAEGTPTRQGIKVAELGRRPKVVMLNPDEQGRSIQQMIDRNQLRPGMEYFINGQRMPEGTMVMPGDAVVSVPRIRGG